jgi:hypothetical protein
MAPAGAQSNYIPSLQGEGIEQKESEIFLEMPEGGEFRDSNQVKAAFIAYLKKIRKNGKPLSETTVYDYSSRIKSLWVYFEKEWKSGMLEGKVQIREEKLKQGETYLNVYNNLELLEKFIEYKGNEIKEREAKGRPFSSEELAQSPLNSYKNVNNCSAALAKFRAFRDMVDEIVKARVDV